MLATSASGYNDFDQSFTVGETYLITGSIVNNFRGNRGPYVIARTAPSFFGPQSVGINIYSYLPNFTSLSLPAPVFFDWESHAPVRPRIEPRRCRPAKTSASFTAITRWVWREHGALELEHLRQRAVHGQLSFTGQGYTGFALADFFTGQSIQPDGGRAEYLFVRDWYFGLYAQDAWKLRPGITFTYGLRWEPFFPMSFANGEVYHFDLPSFLNGTRTTQFANAPPGLVYPGDPGFPGKAGMNSQLNQFAPRIGLVWDPKGNGKMSVRAAYGIFYDTVPAQYNLNTATAPPWGDRTTVIDPPGGLANPFLGETGGNPFPQVFNAGAPYSLYGTYNTFNYNTHPTYVEQWNVSVERQFGNDWLAADRLPGQPDGPSDGCARIESGQRSGPVRGE